MEPMNLGSAPSSPIAATASGFLPPFLMGQQEASTPKHITSTSPRLNRGTYNLSILEETSPIVRQRLFGPQLAESPSLKEPIPGSSNKGGPPKQSLFDTIDITKHGSSNDSSALFDASYSLNTQPEYLTNWVTVFGFSPTVVNSILTIFASCGTILEKTCPPQGNWLNLKYSTKWEAAKALSLNGTLLLNNIIIGVIPCTDKPNSREVAETSRSIHTSYSSPMRARSLKHSFTSPQSSNSVVPMQNVPQKSTGIVTKAMEYVFGW